MISNCDLVAVLSKLLGRMITYPELSFDDDKAPMIRAGVPEPIAEMNAQAFSLIASGDAEWITQDVPSILRRPARSFEHFASDYARRVLLKHARASSAWALPSRRRRSAARAGADKLVAPSHV